MADDLLDAIHDQLSDSVVGIVERVQKAGSRVLGSGVLVSIEGRRGILTCGHVVEGYDEHHEIGMARLISRTQQRRIVDISGAKHVIVQSEPVQSGDDWTETGFDIAFTLLTPEVADSIAAQSVFLNIEKNRERIEGDQTPIGPYVDVAFGLVAEYSGRPVIEDGRWLSPMRAVLYRGTMRSDRNGLLRFQTIDDDPENLPKHFGGLSGSGLWRIHFVDHGAGKFDIIEKRLWGLASWQMDTQNNRGAIAGQGWDRIDQALIPEVLKHL
jgi:hypothetical protein